MLTREALQLLGTAIISIGLISCDDSGGDDFSRPPETPSTGTTPPATPPTATPPPASPPTETRNVRWSTAPAFVNRISVTRGQPSVFISVDGCELKNSQTGEKSCSSAVDVLPRPAACSASFGTDKNAQAAVRMPESQQFEHQLLIDTLFTAFTTELRVWLAVDQEGCASFGRNWPSVIGACLFLSPSLVPGTNSCDFVRE